MTPTASLTGLSLPQLEEFLAEMQEPRYRAKQIFAWLYKHGVSSFQEMTNLPEDLRTRLEASASIGTVKTVAEQSSTKDRTMKFLFELSDGLRIESVLIPPRKGSVDEEKRLTVCISTQVGCPLDCAFCATGTMGYKRNLSAGEIIGQVQEVARRAHRPVTNVVFMGMGEPMLNYVNVMQAIGILTAETGMALSPRRITVSTAGYAQQIKQMADDGAKVKLAISLHSLDTETRSRLMPITKKHSVEELLAAAAYYFEKTKKSIMIEYILFDGINDSHVDAKRLVKASRHFQCRVNLIPYHSIDFVHPEGFAAGLRGSPPQKLAWFSKELRDAGIPAFIRDSAGEDIAAACGQLAAKEL